MSGGRSCSTPSTARNRSPRSHDPLDRGPQREAVRPQRRVVQLVPRDRHRHRRARGGPRAVGRDQGLVDGVLRVVEPRQATAVALAPLPADQLRHDGTDRLRQPLDPGPGRREVRRTAAGVPHRHPDLDAAAAGHLGLPADPEVLQRRAVQPGEHQQVVPRRLLPRVQVDHRVGRAPRVVRQRRPRVPLQRAEVRRPHQRGRLVDDEVGPRLPLVRLRVVPPRHPVGRVLRQLLVPEARPVRAVREAVHVEGPARAGRAARPGRSRAAYRTSSRLVTGGSPSRPGKSGLSRLVSRSSRPCTSQVPAAPSSSSAPSASASSGAGGPQVDRRLAPRARPTATAGPGRP